MAKQSDDPFVKVLSHCPDENFDSQGVDPAVLRRMQAYGYLDGSNLRTSVQQRLAHAWRKDGLVLFLGAGVSSDSGIPGWRRLLDNLLAGMVGFSGDSAAGHKNGSASLMLQTDVGLPMTSQFDLIAHKCEGSPADKEKKFVDRLRDELYKGECFAQLRELLDAIPEDNEAKLAHDWKALRQALSRNDTLAAVGDLIARGLVRKPDTAPSVHAVLTTNVDNLLEAYVMSALDGKRRLNVISDPSFSHKQGEVPVYHLHGWLDMRTQRRHGAVGEPPLVFRESEYFRTMARPDSFANNTAQHYFQRNRVLFIGTSLEDLNVRRWLFNAFEERQLAHRKRLESRFPDHAAATSEAYAASIRHVWFKRKNDLPEPRETIKAFFEDAMHDLGIEILWYDEHAEIAECLRKLAA